MTLFKKSISEPHKLVEIIDYLNRTTNIAHRSSPETDEQCHFVLNWSGFK